MINVISLKIGRTVNICSNFSESNTKCRYANNRCVPEPTNTLMHVACVHLMCTSNV